MNNLFNSITAYIGPRLKHFFLFSYLLECVVGFVSALIGFILLLIERQPVFAFLCILNGLILPFLLYPSFLIVYGFAMIVHRAEEGEGVDVSNNRRANGNAVSIYVKVSVIIIVVAFIICSVAAVVNLTSDAENNHIFEKLFGIEAGESDQENSAEPCPQFSDLEVLYDRNNINNEGKDATLSMNGKIRIVVFWDVKQDSNEKNANYNTVERLLKFRNQNSEINGVSVEVIAIHSGSDERLAYGMIDEHFSSYRNGVVWLIDNSEADENLRKMGGATYPYIVIVDERGNIKETVDYSIWDISEKEAMDKLYNSTFN